MKAGTRPMHIASFHAQSYVVLDEPLDSRSGLEVEFERATQIWRSYPGCSDARSAVNKRNPPSSARKVVSQMRCKTHEPFSVRRELRAGEELSSQFPVTPIPMPFSAHVPQHVAIGKAD